MEEKRIRGCGPPPKYGAKSIVKSVRMPETLWVLLGELSEIEGISRNEIIVRTMVRKVRRDLKP